MNGCGNIELESCCLRGKPWRMKLPSLRRIELMEQVLNMCTFPQVPGDRSQPSVDSRDQGTRHPLCSACIIKENIRIAYPHIPLRLFAGPFGLQVFDLCSSSAATTTAGQCQVPRFRSEFGRVMGKRRSVAISLLIVTSKTQTSSGALFLAPILHVAFLTIPRLSPPFHTFPPPREALRSQPALHIQVLLA